MDILKAIDELIKKNGNSFGNLCISIREMLKKQEGNFSDEGKTTLVSKLNDFLGSKSEEEKRAIVCDIAVIMSHYDYSLYSAYEIEKKLLESL